MSLKLDIITEMFSLIESTENVKLDEDYIKKFFKEKKNLHETIPVTIHIGVFGNQKRMTFSLEEQELISFYKVWKIKS